MQNISYSLILAALVNATGGMGPITYGSTNQDRFSIPCGQSHSTMALGHPRPQAHARAALTVALGQAVEQLIVIGSFALKECCGWEGNAG